METAFKEIDVSTTFFKVHIVTGEEDVLMKTFASQLYKYYEPQHGFGYFHATGKELNELQPHKKVILMEEVCFDFNNIARIS